MDKAYSILRNLSNSDSNVRLQAAQSAELVPSLKEIRSSGLRGNIIRALGLIGVGALEHLLILFNDPDFDFCIHDFAVAFGRVGETSYNPLSKMYQVADTNQRYRIAIVLGH